MTADDVRSVIRAMLAADHQSGAHDLNASPIGTCSGCDARKMTSIEPGVPWAGEPGEVNAALRTLWTAIRLSPGHEARTGRVAPGREGGLTVTGCAVHGTSVSWAGHLTARRWTPWS